jgi:branched-chain amino acid transport system permease protein
MEYNVIIQCIISGLLIGFVYSLIAVGLCLIWGLMEIVNFAHGDFLMLSMFAAFWTYTLFSIDPLLSLPLCTFLLFIIGVLTYKGIINKIIHAPFLAQIIATFGLGIFLRSLAQFLWSGNYRVVENPWLKGRLDIAGIFIGLPQLVASLMAVVVFAFLYWFINRTEIGKALQATSEDKEAAALVGINSDRMFTLGWGIGAACVGVAGALLANFFYIFPDVGLPFGLIAFVAVALGGFGSITGAFIAGAVIGLVETMSGLFISPAFKYVAVFILYGIVVVVKPKGFFGRY